MEYATHRSICRYFKATFGQNWNCLKTSSFKITKHLLCSLIKCLKSQVTCTFNLAGKNHIPVFTLQQLIRPKIQDFLIDE